jgi:hypothetical protein
LGLASTFATPWAFWAATLNRRRSQGGVGRPRGTHAGRGRFRHFFCAAQHPRSHQVPTPMQPNLQLAVTPEDHQPNPAFRSRYLQAVGSLISGRGRFRHFFCAAQHPRSHQVCSGYGPVSASVLCMQPNLQLAVTPEDHQPNPAFRSRYLQAVGSLIYLVSGRLNRRRSQGGVGRPRGTHAGRGRFRHFFCAAQHTCSSPSLRRTTSPILPSAPATFKPSVPSFTPCLGPE